MSDSGVLDEAYERLHATGPEFRGWLSNHGPMAADSLLRLGHGAEVARWVDGYTTRLEAPPESRWPIEEDRWRDPLGDASRLGDWLALFGRAVHEEPWTDVLARWWPRLLPGAAASATHGLIRTGHAVRALREDVTDPRLDELGQALGYWAARWQPVPDGTAPRGLLDPEAALTALPDAAMQDDWGARARFAALGGVPGWTVSLGAAASPDHVEGVPAALDALTDAAVRQYAEIAHGEPVMLIHASTAPRAASLVLPSLPPSQWAATYDAAWSVTAAITVAYRPPRSAPAPPVALRATPVSVDSLSAAVLTNHDEHVIKFVEVVRESHLRGNARALEAGARATELITPGW